jgi:hypothetical protein
LWARSQPIKVPFRNGVQALANDIAFHPVLTGLRHQWELVAGGAPQPADDFFLVDEMHDM